MDWFLYDNGLRHERVKLAIFVFRPTLSKKGISGLEQKK